MTHSACDITYSTLDMQHHQRLYRLPVWHDSFCVCCACVTWLVLHATWLILGVTYNTIEAILHQRLYRPPVRHSSFCVCHECVPWLILRATWRIVGVTCNTIEVILHQRLYWPTCVTWIIVCVPCMHDMTQSTCDMTSTMCDTQHQGGDTASTSSSHPCVTWIIVYVPCMRDITHSACDMTHSNVTRNTREAILHQWLYPQVWDFRKCTHQKALQKMKRTFSSEYVTLFR